VFECREICGKGVPDRLPENFHDRSIEDWFNSLVTACSRFRQRRDLRRHRARRITCAHHGLTRTPDIIRSRSCVPWPASSRSDLRNPGEKLSGKPMSIYVMVDACIPIAALLSLRSRWILGDLRNVSDQFFLSGCSFLPVVAARRTRRLIRR
jgi:hypothetical protein